MRCRDPLGNATLRVFGGSLASKLCRHKAFTELSSS